MILSYGDFLQASHEGFAELGLEEKLRTTNKALYRASIWYAKRSGSIVHRMLVEKLSVLVGKLKERDERYEDI